MARRENSRVVSWRGRKTFKYRLREGKRGRRKRGEGKSRWKFWYLALAYPITMGDVGFLAEYLSESFFNQVFDQCPLFLVFIVFVRWQSGFIRDTLSCPPLPFPQASIFISILSRYHAIMFCAIVSSFFSYDYHFWQFVKIIVFLNMRVFNITFVVDRLEWDSLFNGKTCIIQVHIFLERNMNIKYCSLVMSFLFNLRSEHNHDSQLFYS